MRRRGPDDEGTWQGEGVVLGHRRLAILDLDPRAAQPMQSICGRYVIVFNGEVWITSNSTKRQWFLIFRLKPGMPQ